MSFDMIKTSPRAIAQAPLGRCRHHPYVSTDPTEPSKALSLAIRLLLRWGCVSRFSCQEKNAKERGRALNRQLGKKEKIGKKGKERRAARRLKTAHIVFLFRREEPTNWAFLAFGLKKKDYVRSFAGRRRGARSARLRPNTSRLTTSARTSR